MDRSEERPAGRLPPEFSLAAYQATGSFQPQDWLANLAVRCWLMHSYAGDAKNAAIYMLRNPLLSERACMEILSFALGDDIRSAQVSDLSTFDLLDVKQYFQADSEMQPYVELYERYWRGDTEVFDKLCVFQPNVDARFSRSWKAFQMNVDAVSG
jgi:hypothetical protein